MTLNLKRLRKMEEAATAAPWIGSVNCWVRPIIGNENSYTTQHEDIDAVTAENALFIAEARNQMPELLDLIEKWEEWGTAALELFKEFEAGDSSTYYPARKTRILNKLRIAYPGTKLLDEAGE